MGDAVSLIFTVDFLSAYLGISLFMYPGHCLTVAKWLANNWHQGLKQDDGKLMT